MRSARPVRGFTLLEVLVALAILASALYAATGGVRSAARQQLHRETTVLALWVAMNVATELELAPPAPDALPSPRAVKLYDQVFVASVAPVTDEDGKLTALTLAVAREDAPDDVLQTLTLPVP